VHVATTEIRLCDPTSADGLGLEAAGAAAEENNSPEELLKNASRARWAVVDRHAAKELQPTSFAHSAHEPT